MLIEQFIWSLFNVSLLQLCPVWKVVFFDLVPYDWLNDTAKPGLISKDILDSFDCHGIAKSVFL